MRDLDLAIINNLCTHITGWAKQSISDITVLLFMKCHIMKLTH